MSLNLPTNRDYTKSIYWNKVEDIMSEKWCPNCYRQGCPKCNGTGFIQTGHKVPPQPKAGHPEPTTHVPLTKWEVEDKAFEIAYKRWERSQEKREGFSFDEYMLMDKIGTC